MEILINIPAEEFERLVYMDIFKTREYIQNGIVLPKGHGRLIDADKAAKVMLDEMCGTGYQSKAMHVVESEFCTPTIIEADKVEDENDD